MNKAIKCLHLSDNLYPMVTGGTELFIEQLIHCQRDLECPYEILWAAHKRKLSSPDHSPETKLANHKHLLPPIITGSRLDRVSSITLEAPKFHQLLDNFQPDIVHMHTFSDLCGLTHARAIKGFGAKLLLTMHAPLCGCMGNIEYANPNVSDGFLRSHRCTAQRLQLKGLPNWLAKVVALQKGYPLSANTPSKLAHLLTARQLTEAMHSSWLELLDLADGVHVLADWSKQMLLKQGICSKKIHLIRTAGPPPLPSKKRLPMEDGILRLAYWGRCDPVKGLHLVIDAILSISATSPIQLDFFGPYWESDYGQKLLNRINGDSRFRIQGNLPKEKVLERLQTYDLAVVPSTWYETGPLTVLEAFSAGLPVAGSNIGGIYELLVNLPGCALLPTDSDSWRKYIIKVLNKPELLDNKGIPKPIQFSKLAADLNRIIIPLIERNPNCDQNP